MLQRTGCDKSLGIVLSCQPLCSCIDCLPDLRTQDPIREQGTRIQRCQFYSSSNSPITDKTKVLLYNFFEDSTATPNQWRLVLNGISNRDNLSGVPTFDEVRHAIVCAEVGSLLLEASLSSPLTLSGLVVEITVRCSYSGSEQSVDRGQFQVS